MSLLWRGGERNCLNAKISLALLETEPNCQAMNPRVRQAEILDFVRQNGRATVEELARRFEASRETIRRDLSALSEGGQIQKIHGGAKIPDIHGEGPFRERMAANAEAKRAIARSGAALISPGDTLFIDTGSTTLIFAEALAERESLTVVTNSTAIARAIGGGGLSQAIFLLGGSYDSDNQETRGPMAIRQIGAFRLQHAVITVGGVHATAGLTDFDFAESQVAGAMIENAEKLIVLADSSKFDRTGPFAVGSLGQMDYLVSDARPSGKLGEALDRTDVSIVT